MLQNSPRKEMKQWLAFDWKATVYVRWGKDRNWATSNHREPVTILTGLLFLFLGPGGNVQGDNRFVYSHFSLWWLPKPFIKCWINAVIARTWGSRSNQAQQDCSLVCFLNKSSCHSCWDNWGSKGEKCQNLTLPKARVIFTDRLVELRLKRMGKCCSNFCMFCIAACLQ